MQTALRPELSLRADHQTGERALDALPATVEAAYVLASEALARGEDSSAVSICQRILDSYPGDLRAHALLGCALGLRNECDLAIKSLEFVVDRDPENVEALVELGLRYRQVDRHDLALDALTRAFELEPDRQDTRDGLLELRRELTEDDTELPLAPAAAVTRWHLRRRDPESAVDLATSELAAHPRDVLLQMLRAEALWRADRLDEAERACRQLVTRLPRTIKPRLILGWILCADPAREADGVELLHAITCEDLAGVVARRLVEGTDFWLPSLASELTIALPSEDGPPDNSAPTSVRSRNPSSVAPGSPWTGANLADSDDVDSLNGGGELTDSDQYEEAIEPTPEHLSGPVQTSLDETGLTQWLIAVTIKSALAARYGSNVIDRLDRRARAVRRELRAFDTGFDLVYVDDSVSMADLECAPVTSRCADDVRRAIDEVTRAIQRRNERDAGSTRFGVLLLGGDDIIPHFRVPNPADDDDTEILTDNPYGAGPTDSLLTGGVPVGRLPDGSAENVSLLLRQLDLLVDARRRPRLPGRPHGLAGIPRRAWRSLGIGRPGSSPFALATADLETVAGHVVGPLANVAVVRSSPPALVDSFDPTWLSGRRCVQFSLNGRSDGYAWFGQASPGDGSSDWEVPVALTADRVVGLSLAAPVVFAASSYSARMTTDQDRGSLAARFIHEGAAAFVGSTGLCYGSNLLPLDGADLLGNCFWRSLAGGLPVGSALVQAKLLYARQMMAEQGFLDGDDQKTLLEFCLYGDPLLPVFEVQSDAESMDDEEAEYLPILLCNRGANGRPAIAADPGELRAAVELIAARCAEAAGGSIRVQRRGCCGGQCGSPLHLPGQRDPTSNHVAVTSIMARAELTVSDGRPLVKIARVSLTNDGTIAKALISR